MELKGKPLHNKQRLKKAVKAWKNILKQETINLVTSISLLLQTWDFKRSITFY